MQEYMSGIIFPLILALSAVKRIRLFWNLTTLTVRMQMYLASLQTVHPLTEYNRKLTGAKCFAVIAIGEKLRKKEDGLGMAFDRCAVD